MAKHGQSVLQTSLPLQKQAYSYIENFTTKNWKFSDKNSDIYHISFQI